MARVAARVTDKRVLKLIRAFLESGVMEGGLVSPVDEGTPQGGPLSPLLSNLVLDDLDKELTRRGHRFCRYAVGCSHVSGLLTRRLWPLALMKSADRIPNHLNAHEALGPRGFLRSPVRPVCHHVSPPLHSPLTSVMQPAERDLGYMAGAT